jgi:hypothetical protein
MVMKAIASLSDDDDSDDPDADAGNQHFLDDLVKPADWPEGKNWGTLTIDTSCTPADIANPTDDKLLNPATESTDFHSVALAEDFCAAVAEEAASHQDQGHDTAPDGSLTAKSCYH